MGLSTLERIVLERRLRRRASSPVAAFLGLSLTAVVALPVAAAGVAVVGAGIAYAALADDLEAEVQTIDNIEDRALFETTAIHDRHGTLLREIFTVGKRTYVKLDDVPSTVRQATIAVEDADFYTNPGIDPGGIARAAYGVVTGEESYGGGSTITQQLVRHVAFTDKERLARSYERKAKEIVLAIILTRQHSKDEILEWYLNEIYYGNLAYGIEAAAQTIFGKPAIELDLAERAPGGPAAGTGGLRPAQPGARGADAGQEPPEDRAGPHGGGGLRLARRSRPCRRPDAGLRQPRRRRAVPGPALRGARPGRARADPGERPAGARGLQVTTTLDMPLQTLAEREVREQVDKLRERQNLNNAALVALEPRTGQILAMVGSAEYWDDAIDGRVNVALRERQPGSSIKPVTYVTAIERGMSPATVLWDVPMEVWTPAGIYKPQNYDETFHGPVRLRRALANSYNIPALKLLGVIPPVEGEDGQARLGVEQTIETAHKMGVTGLQRDPWDYGLSLTLGGGEVTLLDMTTVYATLANQGERVRPNAVLKVVDSAGTVLYDLAQDAEALKPERAVSEGAAFIVTDMLADNEARTPAFGASSPLNIGVPAAVKTGTTNDYRDNWTLGFTPYLVTGVWAGNSDNSAMRNSSGVTGAAPIWSAFMRGVVLDQDLRGAVREAREQFGFDFPTQFQRPKDVVEASVCKVESLNQLAATCQVFQRELFIKDRLPEGLGADGAAPGGAGMAGMPGAAGSADPSGAAGGGGVPGTGGTPGGDGTTQVGAVVVPLPPPPEEVVRAAAEKDEPVKWAPAVLCLPGEAGFGVEKAQPVAVVPLPEDVAGSPIGEEKRFAVEWSRANGWAAVPPLEPCTQAMIDAALATGSLPGWSGGAGGVFTPTLRAEYRLNLRPESVLTARTVLTGTAVFNPDEIEYFKVELGAGRTPREWITLGDIHRGPVTNGALEVLDAPSLPAGEYIVRLILVKKDGNFLDPPFAVPVRLGQAP